MRKLTLPLLLVLAGCSSKSDKFVPKHDTVNVYWLNPNNGVRGWARGVYDTKRTLVAEDSSSKSGNWVTDTAWQVAVTDSAKRDSKNVPHYDSAHKSWFSTTYYAIDKRFVQPDLLPRK